MKRRPTHELLDTDSGSPHEVAESLRDLRWFNQWFGGTSTVRRMFGLLRERTSASKLSVLEIAAGDGYVPAFLRLEFAESGLDLDFTLLDRAASHLPSNGSFPKVGGDALRLPFGDSSFDVVCCSLFVHHLAPDDVVKCLRESLRVSRTAVLIHDLIRHPLHLALAYAGVPLYRSRITRNDAPASVRQAYTAPEIRQFLLAAGAGEVEIHEGYLFRMGAIAWKRSAPR